VGGAREGVTFEIVGREVVRLLFAAALLLLVGCGSQAQPSLGPAAAQALRTCVDRWNEGNMTDWGPAPARVALRRLDYTRRRALGLPPGPRRCVVSVGVGRRQSWSCELDRFGAYACPLRHEGDYMPLRGRNGRIDADGVLTLDTPVAGTHAPPRLPWQRYPRTDGYVEPWTPDGALRAGLRFGSTYSGGGTCSTQFGSEVTPSKRAVRCLWRGLYQVDPCYPPPRRSWNHLGGVVACSYGEGATTFGRFVLARPSYRAIDFPDLEPWWGIGAFRLDETRAEVAHDYDAVGHHYHEAYGYYLLHHSRVYVAFRAGRVNEIAFTTRYYRTLDGFGVGSRIPTGGHWRGFVWNPMLREKPCSCWVKVGDGPQSLAPTGANFLKHWVIVYVHDGRVSEIYMAEHYID
jgi:hypothetical protein